MGTQGEPLLGRRGYRHDSWSCRELEPKNEKAGAPPTGCLPLGLASEAALHESLAICDLFHPEESHHANTLHQQE